MKKQILFSFLICLLTTMLVAQTAQDRMDKARQTNAKEERTEAETLELEKSFRSMLGIHMVEEQLEFEEQRINFGTIKEGEVVRRIFKFVNNGNTPVTIYSVKSYTFKTVPIWSVEPIPPGGFGEIVVDFYSAYSRGEFKEAIKIYSNATEENSYIYLSGEVTPSPDIAAGNIEGIKFAPEPSPPFPLSKYAKMEFEHSQLDFGTVDEGEKVRHTYQFTNTGTEPLLISKAKGCCGTFAKYPRELIAPGESAEINVFFNSRGKKGKRNQKVTITANTDPPETFIYLTGEVFEVKE